MSLTDSDITGLLEAYNKMADQVIVSNKKSKSRPAIVGLLTFLGSAVGVGWASHAFYSRVATKDDVQAVERHVQEVERQLTAIKEAKTPGEAEQTRAIENAQACCDHLSQSFSNYLFRRR